MADTAVGVRLAPVWTDPGMDFSLTAVARIRAAGRGHLPAGESPRILVTPMIPALVAAIVALSRLAGASTPVLEAEVNPLRVGRMGEGAVAVDAVIRLAGDGQAPSDVVSSPTRR